MKRAFGDGSNQNFIEEINNEILSLFEKQENKPECLPDFFPKDVKVNPDLLFIWHFIKLQKNNQPMLCVRDCKGSEFCELFWNEVEEWSRGRRRNPEKPDPM